MKRRGEVSPTVAARVSLRLAIRARRIAVLIFLQVQQV
jgi:hypothetical protein